MWANSVWGLFGLGVTLAGFMLGLPPDLAWMRPWFFGGSIISFIASLIVLCWPLRIAEQRAMLRKKIQHPIKWMAELIEPSHIIILGLVIALCGVIWQWQKTPQEDSQKVTELQSELQSLRTDLKNERDLNTSLKQKMEARPAPQPSSSINKDIAVLLHREIQLSEKIAQAKTIRQRLTSSAESIKRLIKAAPRPIPSAGSPQRQLPVQLMQWDNERYPIYEIYKLIYPEDETAILEYEQTTAELFNKVDGDDDIQDQDIKIKYRRFVLKSNNFIRRTDALITKMESEYMPLRSKIVSMKGEKFLGK